MQTIALESIIINPKNPAKSSIIWLHGLGADGSDFVDIIPELRLPEEYATRFIFPHAPVIPVTLNGNLPMRAWFDIFGLDRTALQDEEGIRRAQQSINQLISNEQAQGIPSSNIVLGGFSQGGAMALFTGIHFSENLAGIFGLSTYLPSKALQETTPAINTQTPVFMAHGQHDPVVGYDLGQASCQRLQQLGCQVEWRSYPMPHSVCPQEIYDLSQWLKKVLNPNQQISKPHV